MQTRQSWRDVFCIVAYIIVCLVLVDYVVRFTDAFDNLPGRVASDFASDWRTEDGQSVDADRISAGEFGGSVVIEKELPQTLRYHDDFCFASNNARVTVWVAGRLTYFFDTKENLTGRGYGTTYHTVGLAPGDAEQTIRIELVSVFDSHEGGRLGEIKICDSANYLRLLAERRFLAGGISGLIIFFGLLMIVVFIWMPKKAALPYDLAALGTAAVIFGIWCGIDTGSPQLLTGGIYVYRVLDYFLLPLTEYPTVRFVTSLTKKKRGIYSRIMLFASMGFEAVLLSLRIFGRRDLHSFTPIAHVSYFVCLAVIVALLVDNNRYCRKNGLDTDMGFFTAGAVCFMAGALLDIGIYIAGAHRFGMHGTFLRLGLCAFVVEMLVQFLRWWSGERTSIERDRFINKGLQYAVSENDPETNINAMLEYLGTELHADRVYIFEYMHDGTFDNTYEWVREGVAPRIDTLKGLPYRGKLDVWFEEFRRYNRVFIPDMEAYRETNPVMYDILKDKGVKRLIVGPLESKGEYLGFFGVDDPPKESMEEIAEIIRLISYFFSQLILQREGQKRLIRYSYYDSLTGVRNRRACLEFESKELDPDGSYGFIMCDINGLKQANDTLGHEAGDQLILDVAKSLREVFGAKNVYRMGGDEFAAYSFAESEEEFNADVEHIKRLLTERQRSASIGTVYCESGAMSNAEVKAEADARMYEEKERYYQGRNDRRH